MTGLEGPAVRLGAKVAPGIVKRFRAPDVHVHLAQAQPGGEKIALEITSHYPGELQIVEISYLLSGRIPQPPPEPTLRPGYPLTATVELAPFGKRYGHSADIEVRMVKKGLHVPFLKTLEKKVRDHREQYAIRVQLERLEDGRWVLRSSRVDKGWDDIPLAISPG